MKLPEEIKAKIIEEYKTTPDLIELTRSVFGDDSLDGRTKEGRAVRQFLVASKLDYKTTQKEKREDIDLSEEQKEFIINNAKDGSTAYEISKILFPEINVTNLSKEVLEVANFIKQELPNSVPSSESAMGVKYFPPKCNSRMIKKINESCSLEIQEEKLNQEELNNVKYAINALKAPRFLQVINNYSSQEDRDLFEAEYVRSVWDKPDLTTDELNLYINVCMDYIHLKNISRAIDKLNRMFEECEDQQDMTVRLAELLKTKSEEYNQCEKRQEALIARLNGDRKERIKNKHKDTASILSLVKLFQIEEERNRMIMMAERQKEIVKDEADRIEEMSSWKARVLGISKTDVL